MDLTPRDSSSLEPYHETISRLEREKLQQQHDNEAERNQQEKQWAALLHQEKLKFNEALQDNYKTIETRYQQQSKEQHELSTKLQLEVNRLTTENTQICTNQQQLVDTISTLTSNNSALQAQISILTHEKSSYHALYESEKDKVEHVRKQNDELKKEIKVEREKREGELTGKNHTDDYISILTQNKVCMEMACFYGSYSLVRGVYMLICSYTSFH